MYSTVPTIACTQCSLGEVFTYIRIIFHIFTEKQKIGIKLLATYMLITKHMPSVAT